MILLNTIGRGRHSHQHFQSELTGYRDNVRWKFDQFFRASPSLRRITACPSDFNPHIVAVDPAQLMQDFLEHGDAGLLICLHSRAHEYADAPHLLSLLRTRGKRPSSRYTADKRDEIASPHWLPSSRGSYPTMVTAALCITANSDSPCPLWVKSGHCIRSA
jgi:hypothetical protein